MVKVKVKVGFVLGLLRKEREEESWTTKNNLSERKKKDDPTRTKSRKSMRKRGYEWARAKRAIKQDEEI